MPGITTHHLLLGAIELAVWYLFIVYFIRTVKQDTGNIWISSAILLVLFYLGFVLCPWLRHSELLGG